MQCPCACTPEYATRPGPARSGSSSFCAPRLQRGFSLLELIIVIILLGILAIAAAPSFTTQGTEEATFAEETRAALRYAQKLALATGCEVQVAVDAGTDGLSVTRRAGGTSTSCGTGGFTQAVTDPAGGGAYQRDAGSEADVTAGLTVVYDGLGRPSTAGTVTIGARSVVVEAESGYVR
jgi:MSHA pilin protein MshC